jgi:hypothetical protein
MHNTHVCTAPFCIDLLCDAQDNTFIVQVYLFEEHFSNMAMRSVIMKNFDLVSYAQSFGLVTIYIMLLVAYLLAATSTFI